MEWEGGGGGISQEIRRFRGEIRCSGKEAMCLSGGGGGIDHQGLQAGGTPGPTSRKQLPFDDENYGEFTEK